jgi:hypothetical protein
MTQIAEVFVKIAADLQSLKAGLKKAVKVSGDAGVKIADKLAAKGGVFGILFKALRKLAGLVTSVVGVAFKAAFSIARVAVPAQCVRVRGEGCARTWGKPDRAHRAVGEVLLHAGSSGASTGCSDACVG